MSTIFYIGTTVGHGKTIRVRRLLRNPKKPDCVIKTEKKKTSEAECLSEGDVDRSDNVSTDKIIPQERIFLWQKGDAVVPCDKGLEYMEVVAENEPEKESPDIRPMEVFPVHVDVFCNTCQNEIVGFRYICVQCPDYDLCAACEARGLHHTHYVLRVPGPRPQSQVHEMLQTIRRVLRQNIEQLRVQTDGTVIDITDEEDPMVKEPPPPSPSLSHERSEYTQDNPNYPQDISDTFDDDSDAPSHTYDPLHLSHEKYKRITKSADPLRKLTPLGPILRVYLKKKGCNMELSNIANYNSKRTKEQLKITDPNQLCENNTNEETPAIECVPKDELDTMIDIQVIHSEPIDETASNETVPPLDKEFLKSLVLKIPEIVNAPKCEYTLHIVHMNCNYYIRVKKKICDASLRKKYCGDKIAYVSLTRLTQEEISAATDKQRRTCT